jgi:hypothetical protein
MEVVGSMMIIMALMAGQPAIIPRISILLMKR